MVINENSATLYFSFRIDWWVIGIENYDIDTRDQLGLYYFNKSHSTTLLLGAFQDKIIILTNNSSQLQV